MPQRYNCYVRVVRRLTQQFACIVLGYTVFFATVYIHYARGSIYFYDRLIHSQQYHFLQNVVPCLF